MNKIRKIVVSTSAAAALAVTAVVGLPAAPAQAHGVLTCAYLQEMYDYSISQMNDYWNQGTYYQFIGDTLEADADFGQYRRWSLNMANIQLC